MECPASCADSYMLKPNPSQAYLLHLKGYTIKSHIGLTLYFESLKRTPDKSLLSKLIKRVQSELKRKVQFLKMKDPNSDFNHKICDRSLASVENLTPDISNLSEDELNVNVLLHEIIKYRQNTLSDERAWDHAAQNILQTTKKAPS